MTESQQTIVMVFGGILSAAGLLLLFLRKEAHKNRIKLLGWEFEISTPSLVVFLVGCGIFVLPFFIGPQPKKERDGIRDNEFTVPHKAPTDEIARRIEELQERLRKNENDQEEARRGIEFWKNSLHSDPSAPGALEAQQRWFDDLQMQREEINQELSRLRGHLREPTPPSRVFLGAKVQQVNASLARESGLEQQLGAYVWSVIDGGPADNAGMRAGDIILQLNGRLISDPRTLADIVSHLEPRQKVNIVVFRNGKERNLQVILGILGGD